MYSDELTITGLTDLQLAAGHNRTQFVENLLMVPGIIVDPKTNREGSPLFYAASWSFVEIVKKLSAAYAYSYSNILGEP